MRKLPPYGTKVRAPENGVWIYVGPDAWKCAKITLKCYPNRAPLVLPDYELPDEYCWPVSGKDVVVDLLSEQSPERVLLLGRALIMAGASRVAVIGETKNLPIRLILFKPLRSEGGAV